MDFIKLTKGTEKRIEAGGVYKRVSGVFVVGMSLFFFSAMRFFILVQRKRQCQTTGFDMSNDKRRDRQGGRGR